MNSLHIDFARAQAREREQSMLQRYEMLARQAESPDRVVHRPGRFTVWFRSGASWLGERVARRAVPNTSGGGRAFDGLPLGVATIAPIDESTGLEP